MKTISIFTFEIEKEIYGLEFELIDRIEDSTGGEEKELDPESSQIQIVDLKEKFLGDKNQNPHRHLLIIEKYNLCLIVDKALDRHHIEGTHILPIPSYLFSEDTRPFKGLFPLNEKACLMLNSDYLAHI